MFRCLFAEQSDLHLWQVGGELVFFDFVIFHAELYGVAHYNDCMRRGSYSLFESDCEPGS